MGVRVWALGTIAGARAVLRHWEGGGRGEREEQVTLKDMDRGFRVIKFKSHLLFSLAV